jgi:hypothetical protein
MINWARRIETGAILKNLSCEICGTTTTVVSSEATRTTPVQTR